MTRFPLFPIALLTTLSLPFLARAQSMRDMKGMNMAAPTSSKAASAATTAHAAGVVKKVDASAGLVTIAHEAIPAIGWPPMTMGFRVEDKKLLGKLVIGNKVDFEFAMGGKGYVVTAVK